MAIPDMALPAHGAAWQALDDEFGRRLVDEPRKDRAFVPSQSALPSTNAPPIAAGLPL